MIQPPIVRLDYEEIMAQLKIAVLAYPMKAIAPEIGKEYQTLSNELGHREDFKLGFISALQILSVTQHPHANQQSRAAGIQALDKIEEGLGRVAFVIPRAKDTEMQPIMELVAKVSKEFGENMQELATAIQDGKITEQEARDCSKETQDLINACIRLQAFLEQYYK